MVVSYASLSVCLYSGLDQKWEKIIHISKSIAANKTKLGHNVLVIDYEYTLRKNNVSKSVIKVFLV